MQSLPSEFLLNLITTIWSDTAGRIFLLSATYYLFSAFAISGYMAFFAGGFGNIGFGDFSLIDFLFFFPTLIVTGLNFVIDNLWRVVKIVALQLILPNLIGLLIAAFLIADLKTISISPPYLASVLLYASIIMWMIGFNVLFSNTQKRFIPFLLQLFGILVFSISAVALFNSGTPSPSISINTTILFMINLLYTIMIIIGLLLTPLVIGMAIAREAVKFKFLSQIQRIELIQPIFGFDQWRVGSHNDIPTSFWDFLKPKQNTSTISQYEPKGEAFLVESLSKVTAIYVHKPDGETGERGKLFLISNNIISSLEIKSGKISI